MTTRQSPGDGLATASGRLEIAIHQASELLQLPEGWNSYEAKPVSTEAARAAIAFLAKAASAAPNLPAPAVVPTVPGGIQLEWHRQGMDLEVEFRRDGYGSWSAEDRETEEAVEQSLLDEDLALQRWLDRASG